MYDSKRKECEQELEELKRRMKHFEGVAHWWMREKRRADNLEFKIEQVKKSMQLPFHGTVS